MPKSCFAAGTGLETGDACSSFSSAGQSLLCDNEIINLKNQILPSMFPQALSVNPQGGAVGQILSP